MVAVKYIIVTMVSHIFPVLQHHNVHGNTIIYHSILWSTTVLPWYTTLLHHCYHSNFFCCVSPGWLDPDVDWPYTSISRPQPAGTTASTRSAPMTGRSERRPNDPMLILFRVHTCHMPKEVQPSLSDKVGNWGQPVVCLTVKLVTCLL